MAITLAIDLGTTNLKVGLVNESGEILNLRSVAVPVTSNSTGEAEHDPEELKNLILGICKELLANGHAGQVEYVVSSTNQFGLMLLDAQNKPHAGISLLSDIR